MPEYRITHQTVYQHSAPPVAAMLQLGEPRGEPAAGCLDFQLRDRARRRPAANTPRPTTSAIRGISSPCASPCRELVVTSHAVVRREGQPCRAARHHAVAHHGVGAHPQAHPIGEGFLLEQYLAPTTQVPLLRRRTGQWHRLRPAGARVDRGAGPAVRRDVHLRLQRHHRQHATRRGAFEKKRGVCQDFTHLFLGCAPAQVAGGLRQRLPADRPARPAPPAGGRCNVAWASVHIPELGWIDYDPTNACFAGAGHIVVARGRDYADVSPTRGVFWQVLAGPESGGDGGAGGIECRASWYL